MKKRLYKITSSSIITILIISVFALPILAKTDVNSAEATGNKSGSGNYENFAVSAVIPAASTFTSNVGKRIYLSDINYITTDGWSYNGWSGHQIEYDKTQDGGKLSLILNGQRTYFAKGLSVHAKGQITYDISELSATYPRFIAYMGVDAARGTNGSLWIKVSVSNDGNSWQDLYQTAQMNGSTPAVEVDLSVAGFKYLRIYTDPCGSNGADHATIASAALVTEDFDKTASYYNKLRTVDYYDNILKKYSAEENYSNNYRLVLEREVVSKLGHIAIDEFAELNENGIKTLDWLLSRNEITEQIIEVGEIANTPKFLEILADLYANNEAALNSERLIYAKMAIGLAATYTTDSLNSPLRFSGYASTYDYVERYRLMKQLFDKDKFMYIKNNQLVGEFVHNDWFENLHVELIRMIMHEAINPEEIMWLNGYTHDVKSMSYGMVPYIHPQYTQAKLYDEANRETYDSKYFLSKYGVPYGDQTQRYWMVLEAGGICWNQSRFGQSMFHMNGIPAIGAYQPWHEMYFNYAQDENGNGYWSERYGNYNDAGTTWYGGNRYRLIFNWGAKSFTDQNIRESKGGTSLGYLYLAQANLNNYSKYKKSLYYNLIANSYDDNNKKIETYFNALEVNDINLDSFDYIIKLYKQMSDKNPGGTITSNDWYQLALKVTESYKYYPVAMYDLLQVIRPYLEGEEKLDIDVIEKRNLTAAVNVSNETLASIGAVNAGSGVRTHAKRLLGLAQPDPMTFSFDGENARKIVKDSNYALTWAYSLDGGQTYTDWTDADFVELTQAEIESITSQNDIIIKFMGLSYTFTVDITDGVLPSNLYPNDWENRIIAATDVMEWRMGDSEEWTSFRDQVPDLTGDKTVEVRTSYTERKVPSATETYVFTADNQPDTAKYIPIEHLSVQGYSTQSQDSGRPFHAPNAIDGNMKTLWHTDFRYDVRQSSIKPFIVIKLDEPRNISALEFAQIKYKPNDPDYIKDAIIYVSVDGESWAEAGRIEGCTQENKLRRIDFPQSAYGQYVKIELSTYSMFASLAMVNLYEDLTVKTIATFSFDGSHAGQIVLTDEFKGKAWEYSLDGGNTWKQANGDETQLQSSELQQINENDDIKVRVTEGGGNIESTIVILKQQLPVMPSNMYLNDLENRLIGLSDVSGLEWKIDDGSWTSYQDEEPVVTGTRKLYIRKQAAGNLTASDALEYQFTEDNQPDTAKYIPIKHLSIHDFSSETVRTGNQEQAVKAIDGNNNTKWHTSRTAVNDEKYITVKLDEPRYISKIQYNKEAGYVWGVPKNGIVYTSMDGVNWEEALVFENLYNPDTKAQLAADVNQKDIVLNESVLTQYVRIKVTTSCDYVNGSANGVPYNYFFSSTMLNLFEDITKKTDVLPTAEVEYSITSLTNRDVEAKLVNPSSKITVTNNGGKDTYVFTENGSFVFEFVDDAGNKGTATATVDWIDKKEIKADIAYNINTKTNRDVTATIAFNKENVTVKGGNTHVFTDNGEFTFEYADAAGNTGTATATVYWIDKVVPTATVTYDINSLTNQNVTATIMFDEADVTVTGGDTHLFTDNGEFTFEFVDVAGNKGTATAKVDWIDRTLPKATITFDRKELTNQNVTATVTFDKENVTVIGGNTYVFTENGEYEFEFVGPAGNKGTAIAKVDWIDKKAPTATVSYNPPHLTNQDVTATITFDEENVTVTGGDTHVFTDNGEFTFEFSDAAGNKGTAKATVNWIDRTLPKATITYDVNELTNQDVTATITFDKENVTVTGGNTHVFTENGEYEFEFVGPAGNKGTAIAKVDWIDKKAPTATVSYSPLRPTSQNVTATVAFDEENVTVKGGDSHVFTDNGEFIFEFVDAAGNKGTAVAIVSWIDRTPPKATISYDINELTNQDVTATITFDKEVSFLTEGFYAEELSNNTYRITFTENKDFTLEFIDSLGNKGSLKIKVNWIDKTAPTATVTYDITEITNKDVTATVAFDEENVTVTGGNIHVFTKNGEFTFEFVDAAGNKGTAKAQVNWIDKTAPTATITYDITELTNQDVTATVMFDEENVTVTGGNTHVFTKNGEFTFEFVDAAGNTGTVTAKVDWIKEKPTEAPKLNVTYSTVDKTEGPVTVTLELEEGVTVTNNGGSNTYTFTENGEFTFEYVDEYGNVGTATAKVDWIDKPEESSKPEESTNPEESSNPEESTNPEESSKPEESTNPEESSKPEESTNPEETSKPEESSKPEEPSKSEQVHGIVNTDNNTMIGLCAGAGALCVWCLLYALGMVLLRKKRHQ